jgi:hypothetical protein
MLIICANLLFFGNKTLIDTNILRLIDTHKLKMWVGLSYAQIIFFSNQTHRLRLIDN